MESRFEPCRTLDSGEGMPGILHLHLCMFRLCFVSEPTFIFMYRISRYSWGEQGICFGNLRIAPLLLWMMWFCWFNQSVTFSMHWSGLQPSEKQVGWESAPPNPRQRFSARAQWNDGEEGCLKQENPVILGCHSQVMGRWSTRWIGALMQHQQ